MRASDLLSAALQRMLIVVGVAAGGWLLAALLSSAAFASADEPCDHGSGVTSAAPGEPLGAPEAEEPAEALEPELPAEAAEPAVEHAAVADAPQREDIPREQPPAPEQVEATTQAAPVFAQVEPPDPQQPYAPETPVGGLLGTVTKTVTHVVGTVTTTVHTVTNTVNNVTGTINGTIEAIAPIVDVPGTLPDLGITLPDVLPSTPDAGSGDGAVIAVPAEPVPGTLPPGTAPAQHSPATAVLQPSVQSDATRLATTPVPWSPESGSADAPEAGGGGSPGGGGPVSPLPAGPVSFATGTCSIAAPQDNAAGRSVHGILSWAPTLTQLRLVGASRDHDADGAGRAAALPATTPD